MRWSASFLFILLLLPSLANGADTTYYCRDNVTLVKIDTTVINVPELGITRTFISEENFTCPYGCDETHDVCYEAPSRNWAIAITIIAGVIIGSWLIYYIFRGR